MRTVRYLEHKRRIQPKLQPTAESAFPDISQWVDNKNMAVLSGMGFTALGAYFYFVVQHLNAQVIGVTLLSTVLGFLLAFLLKIDILKIELSVQEKLNIRFMIGVLFMLSLVIIGSALSFYGPESANAFGAFILVGISTYLLLHSREEENVIRLTPRP